MKTAIVAPAVLALCMMIPQIDRILNIKKPILKGVATHD